METLTITGCEFPQTIPGESMPNSWHSERKFVFVFLAHCYYQRSPSTCSVRKHPLAVVSARSLADILVDFCALGDCGESVEKAGSERANR
jgi:hypothetical protein